MEKSLIQYKTVWRRGVNVYFHFTCGHVCSTLAGCEKLYNLLVDLQELSKTLLLGVSGYLIT